MCFLPWFPLIDKYCVGCLKLTVTVSSYNKSTCTKNCGNSYVSYGSSKNEIFVCVDALLMLSRVLLKTLATLSGVLVQINNKEMSFQL